MYITVNGIRKSGFHLKFADSTYKLRTLLTVADSATARFNHTNVLSFVCGFHKLFWIPQIQSLVNKFAYFSSEFEQYNDYGVCLWNPKQHKDIKEK